MNYNVCFKGHRQMCGGSCRECLTYSNTDRHKQKVCKALTYSKLGEYAPHLNYHHHNGDREVRLVLSVTSSGRSMRSTERTCNGGTGWQLVYHMNALLCLASFQVAPSATNQICQTPPWTPATSILYYGMNYWHWCCINCWCLLRYIIGLVVPVTSKDRNAFRISGRSNPITKPHIPEDPQILRHTTVWTSNTTNIFFFIYMTQSTKGLRCGYT
jgi:hypothetical protein